MAIPTDKLGTAVQAWLIQQGFSPNLAATDAVVTQQADGTVAVSRWNTATCGPQPTLVQLEAALTNSTTLRNGYDRQQQLDMLGMRAIARAVHVRFGRADAATRTGGPS